MAPSLSDPTAPERIAALQRYDILDSPDEPAFDRVAQLAARLLDAPMAGIHFIDEVCQWAKSQFGLDAKTLDLDVSFCIHELGTTEVLIVPDTTKDRRFEANPLVTGDMGIRFYAGASLITPDGYALGRLCVLDTTARPAGLSASEAETLRQLADVVMDELEYRAQPRHREEILESITDAFFAVDDQWRFTYVNHRAEELLQRTRERLLGNNLWEVFPESRDFSFHKEFQHAVRSGESVQFEGYFRPLQAWFQINAYPLNGGLSVYFDDITDRKRRISIEQRFGRLLDASIKEIYVFEVESLQFIQVSRGGQENLGYSIEALRTMTPLDLKPFDRSAFEDLLRPLQRGAQDEVAFETTHRRADGSTYPVEVHLQMSRQEEPPVFIAIVLDITKRKRRERELVAAKERAEEMSRLKSIFLANMSHEIRTPLTAIIGFADVLSGKVGRDALELVQMIRESGKRLEETLTSVLDLAQLEGKNKQIDPEPLNLSAEVRTAADLFRQKAKAKGIDVWVEVPDDPVEVVLDRGALQRILTNLVSNAIKFTEEGSVQVRLRRAQERVVMEVEDTGIGISPEQGGRIFGEFIQASEGLTRSYEGTGLGLAITQRLVQLLGGTIQVDSETGVGSTFVVVLPRGSAGSSAKEEATEGSAVNDAATSPAHEQEQPRESANPTGAVPASTSEAAHPPPVRVLLVDDNKMTRKVLPMLLEGVSSKYAIEVAASPDSALTLASAKPYDLFLIDINLGAGRSGIDVLDRLRGMLQYRSTPMVACTAYALPADEKEFLSRGFDAYVAKPFRAKELLEVLERL